MEIFAFRFKAKPDPGHPNYVQCSGASAEVFVVGNETEAEAEAKARDHVEKQGWIIEELVVACLVPKEALSGFGPNIALAISRALQHGVASVFHAGKGGGPQFN